MRTVTSETSGTAIPRRAGTACARGRRSRARGTQRFRARQIFQLDLPAAALPISSAMTDLSRELRASARQPSSRIAHADARAPRDVDRRHREVSCCGSATAGTIESVFIPDTPAMTFCISTQVGCAMACAFCLTGKMGLVRNLTAGEIVGQVRVLVDAHSTCATRAFNIVLMGMGEPLHNYDETMKALRILARRARLRAARRGASRCRPSGCLPALEQLAREPLMPNLAISLHAPTDEQRGELVPINRKYGVARHHRRLQAIPAEAPQPHHLRVRAARRRQRLGPKTRAGSRSCSQGVKSKVNLIPLNAAAGIPFERPSDDARSIDSRRFSPTHASDGVGPQSRGRDIRAACGQLIVEGQKRSAAQQLAVDDVTSIRTSHPSGCASWTVAGRAA